MSFESEVDRYLPPDFPARQKVLELTARHLDLIAEANRHFNLTRLLDPHDAAIKHVIDSLLPWRHFSNAARVLDAGTGAGFPGIPLAIALPDVSFVLVDSVGKKARFASAAAAALGLRNVTVEHTRAEEFLRASSPHVITGRALAPLPKFCELFRSAIERGSRALLYKGPDVDAEIDAAVTRGISMRVLERYQLPDGAGSRTLVEVRSA